MKVAPPKIADMARAVGTSLYMSTPSICAVLSVVLINLALRYLA